MHARAVLSFSAVVFISAPVPAAAQGRPFPAERSGPSVPEPRELDVTAMARGAYVPRSAQSAPGRAATFGGAFSWCFSPFERLALFGRHEVSKYWWSNVELLALGHEVGARLAAARHLTFEGAFLSHRIPRAWIDEYETHPGGVSDMGAELGAWAPFAPHPRILLDIHLLTRLFEVYRDTQGALGAGARLTLVVAPSHEVLLELTIVRAVRGRPRSGVDETTWNLIGEVSWRSRLASRVGTALGVRLSTSMLVGEQPMMELKRSMIDEPMGLAYAGVSFGI